MRCGVVVLSGNAERIMRIFLSYASENRTIAEDIYLALAGVGHDVFFDRDSLPATAEYHNRIRAAIMAADAMVFLIGPHSVSDNSYTLTELKFAREKWTHPKDRVLPVMVCKTDWDRIPSYLKAVTVLIPAGNVAAEVAAAVSGLSRDRTGTGFAITMISENEIVYPRDTASTLNDVAAALSRLGRIITVDQEKLFIEGRSSIWISTGLAPCVDV
jgi:TIR domain